MILIDTLRADALGTYNPAVKISSELDLLAKRGVQFTTAVAQSSWTRPSVAALFTSHFPRTLGIEAEHGDKLREEFTTLAELLSAAGYRTYGAVANPYLNRTSGYAQGFDTYLDQEFFAQQATSNDPTCMNTLQSGNPTASCVFAKVQESLGKVSNEQGTRPFFAFINLMEVHDRRPVEIYDAVERDSRAEGVLRAERQGLIDAYMDAVRVSTTEVARFIQSILAQPASADTLFIVLSDHGEGFFDHPCVVDSFAHGRVLYRSNVKVPLLMIHGNDPLFSSKLIRAPAQLIDLLPTILRYVGVETPTDVVGQDITELLENPALDSPDWVNRPIFTETHFRGAHKTAIIQGHLQAIKNYEKGISHEVTLFAGPQTGCYSPDKEGGAFSTEQIYAPLFEDLNEWEARFPRAKNIVEPSPTASDEETQILKTLGYLGAH